MVKLFKIDFRAIKKLYSTSTMPNLRGDFLQIEEAISPLAKKASKKAPTKSCRKSTAKAALAELNTASKFVWVGVVRGKAFYSGFDAMLTELAL